MNIDDRLRLRRASTSRARPGSNGFTAAAGVAATNIALHNGDDRVYLSSNANLDQSTWSGFDFLTGNLDDFRGALNIDLGTGRQRLFVSDEALSHPDAYSITDTTGRGDYEHRTELASGADIYLTRSGLPGISYAVTAGNLFDGVNYWTGTATTSSPSTGRSRTAPSGRRRSSTPASATTASPST